MYNKSLRSSYLKKWKSGAPSHVAHWDRSYVKLTWSFGSKKFSLVPIHLLEPWAAIEKAKGGFNAFSSFIANTGDNPLNNQIMHLQDKLTRDFGEDLSENPFVLLGDFNIPKRIFGLTPRIYANLSKDLSEAFWGNPKTFPTKSTKGDAHKIFKHISIKIDHAFSNKYLEFSEREVIHLKGSDHYPLYLLINES